MSIKNFSYVMNAISAALHMGIDEIIIDPGGVRGVDECKTVVMLQIGMLPFGSFAIKNIYKLASEINLKMDLDGYEIREDIRMFGISDVRKQAVKLKKFNLKNDIRKIQDKSEARDVLLAEITELVREHESFENKEESKLIDLENKKNVYEKKVKSDKDKFKYKKVGAPTLKKIPKRIESNEVKLKDLSRKIKIKSNIVREIKKDLDFLVGAKKTVYELGDYTDSIRFVSKIDDFSMDFSRLDEVRAPRGINDTQKILINIRESDIELIKKIRKFSDDLIEIDVSKKGVFLNMFSEDGNTTIKLGSAECDIDFRVTYLLINFVKLIDCAKSFTVGEKGTLKAIYKGFDFFVLPKYKGGNYEYS